MTKQERYELEQIISKVSNLKEKLETKGNKMKTRPPLGSKPPKHDITKCNGYVIHKNQSSIEPLLIKLFIIICVFILGLT